MSRKWWFEFFCFFVGAPVFIGLIVGPIFVFGAEVGLAWFMFLVLVVCSAGFASGRGALPRF